MTWREDPHTDGQWWPAGSPPATGGSGPTKFTKKFLAIVAASVVATAAVAVPATLLLAAPKPAPANTSQPPSAALLGAPYWFSQNGSVNYTLVISAVYPASATINPTDLRYTLLSSFGTPFYDAAANVPTAAGPAALNVEFHELLEPGRVSPGDKIDIKVSPADSNPLFAGWISVQVSGRVLATSPLSGLIDAEPLPTTPMAILQGAGSWSSNSTVTTYTFTISSVIPGSANVDPTQLEYIVSNSVNTPLYSGAADLYTSSGGFTVNVHYQDPLSVGLVSAGDRIQITVTPVASNPLVGGNLQVNFNGNSLATGRM